MHALDLIELTRKLVAADAVNPPGDEQWDRLLEAVDLYRVALTDWAGR
ncbi:hypothetical protein [Paraburkholderia sp. DGU8]|jgi:hypothetical protein